MSITKFNCISIVGNISSISDIKVLPSNKKYKFIDICQNTKYVDKSNVEHENKSYYTVRLSEEQLDKYSNILNIGNWIQVIGKLTNFIGKDNNKKFVIIANSIKEMKEKNKSELFDYDWLNDPELEEDCGI